MITIESIGRESTDWGAKSITLYRVLLTLVFGRLAYSLYYIDEGWVGWILAGYPIFILLALHYTLNEAVKEL